MFYSENIPCILGKVKNKLYKFIIFRRKWLCLFQLLREKFIFVFKFGQ